MEGGSELACTRLALGSPSHRGVASGEDSWHKTTDLLLVVVPTRLQISMLMRHVIVASLTHCSNTPPTKNQTNGIRLPNKYIPSIHPTQRSIPPRLWLAASPYVSRSYGSGISNVCISSMPVVAPSYNYQYPDLVQQYHNAGIKSAN